MPTRYVLKYLNNLLPLNCENMTVGPVLWQHWSADAQHEFLELGSGQLFLHGLNAVYLKSINQWIRLDARGNKDGIYAQFSIDTEKLAFQIRSEYGEVDEPLIYAIPTKT